MRYIYCLSTGISILATFFVSGILHEYVNYVLFSSSAASVFKLKNILFFSWNGVLILAEHATAKWKIVNSLSVHLPQFVKSSLVLLTALPLAHLFTGDWIEAGYFDHISLCVPSIIRITGD